MITLNKEQSRGFIYYFKYFFNLFLVNYIKFGGQNILVKYLYLLFLSSFIEYCLVFSLFFIGIELSYIVITIVASAYMCGFMILFSFYRIHLNIYNNDGNCLNEDKDKKEKKKISYYIYRIIYFLYNFLWILAFAIIFMIFDKLRIPILLNYLECIIPCYYIFVYLLLVFACFLYFLVTTFVLPIIKNFDKTNLLTAESVLYYVFFISFVLSKLLSFKCLEKFLFNSGAKDKQEYEIVLKQNDLLIFYINIVVTLILKPLNFDNDYKIIIDALFYSTTCMGLIFSAKEKACACEKHSHDELKSKSDNKPDDDNLNEMIL